MAFDTNRLKFGDLIAGGGAIVLFISMFLDWYNVEFKGFGGTGIGATSGGGNAWDALGIGKILLLIVILGVLGAVVVRAVGAQVSLPVPLSTVILGLGAIAVLYTLFRLLVIPHGDVPSGFDKAFSFGRSIGVFLAFLSALAIAAGGYLSAKERGEAVPGVDGAGLGTGGTGGGGGPLGGQPAAGEQAYGGQQPYAGQPAGAATTAGGVGAASAGAADPGAAAPKADWYPDPQGQARLRYWDGTQWTDQTAD
jgi:hypothetical protein